MTVACSSPSSISCRIASRASRADSVMPDCRRDFSRENGGPPQRESRGRANVWQFHYRYPGFLKRNCRIPWRERRTTPGILVSAQSKKSSSRRSSGCAEASALCHPERVRALMRRHPDALVSQPSLARCTPRRSHQRLCPVGKKLRRREPCYHAERPPEPHPRHR
jgi:hypothetical protein